MSIDELYKVLLTNRPSKELKKREQELFELIPELEACKGFDQNNKWHPYDVYKHILHVVDFVLANLTLRLTVLFHDIGKPLSYTEEKNTI